MTKIAPITFFTGPMFSGKSGALINRIISAQRAGKRVLAIKPDKDTRDKGKIISSIDNPDPEARKKIKMSYPAFVVNGDDPNEVIKIIENNKFDIFIADEVQFFGDWFIDLIRDLAWHESNLIGGWASWRRGYARNNWEGKETVFAGLDLDVFRNHFGISPKLMNIADNVIKLKADCFIKDCENKARFTCRVAPLSENFNESNPVDPGGKEMYESRCGLHWKPPRQT